MRALSVGFLLIMVAACEPPIPIEDRRADWVRGCRDIGYREQRDIANCAFTAERDWRAEQGALARQAQEHENALIRQWWYQQYPGFWY